MAIRQLTGMSVPRHWPPNAPPSAWQPTNRLARTLRRPIRRQTSMPGINQVDNTASPKPAHAAHKGPKAHSRCPAAAALPRASRMYTPTCQHTRATLPPLPTPSRPPAGSRPVQPGPHASAPPQRPRARSNIFSIDEPTSRPNSFSDGSECGLLHPQASRSRPTCAWRRPPQYIGHEHLVYGRTWTLPAPGQCMHACAQEC